MKHILIALMFLVQNLYSYAIDLTTQQLIYQSDDFNFYSEDTNDYSEIITRVEKKNKEFEIIFNKIIPQKIDIYIFSNQISFSRHVFNSEVPVQNATGFADHVSMRFFITSFYDTCKPKESLLQTPVHELIHLYFPSGYIWIREGIACYYADMFPITDVHQDKLPNNFSELHFYSRGVSETRNAYKYSSWIVQFIIEELCNNNIDKFKNYESDPENYKLLGFSNEEELFTSWKEYLTRSIS